MKTKAIVLALALFTGTASAEDWPSWRGPQRNGISGEKGLLDSWTEQGPPLLWQAKGLGGGFSGVAIVGDRIYTMGSRKGGAHLIALELKDGKEVWATLVGGGGPNCTPTVDGELVYALGREGDLLCAKTATGKELSRNNLNAYVTILLQMQPLPAAACSSYFLTVPREVWRKNFGKDFGGKMMSGWGYSESPLVDGDRLICTPGSEKAIIAALDKKTGKTIWESPMPADAGKKGKDGAAYSSVVVSNACGVKQYVQLTGRGVVSVSAADGKPLWVYNKVANGTANIPTPIVKDDYVFCSSGYGTGAALLKVVRDGQDGQALKAEEVYFLAAKDMQNHHGGMVLLGDHVYCGHGHNQGFPLCVEFKTGKIAWSPGRGVGTGSAAVLYADGHLYFRYENGIMALIEANPQEYKLKGSFKLASVKGASWPHPTISGGKLYLRDQDVLMCYDIRK